VYDTGGVRIRMSMRKIMMKIFVWTLKMIRKVFLRRKLFEELSVEYLGSISGKELERITEEISRQYFWKEFEGDPWENICRIF
jgi:deoxyxylulose-5-phosphate synthase